MPEEKQAPKVPEEKQAPKVLLGSGGATEAGWHSIESVWRCEKEYQFQHVRQIRTPLIQTPDAFALGQMFHAGRARWFSLRFATDEKAWAEVLEAVAEASADAGLPVSASAEKRATELLQAYIEYYSRRIAPKPIAAEYKLGPTPLVPGDDKTLWRTARLDDLSFYSEANGQLCVGESKTTSTSIQETVAQYELHGQTMLQYILYANDPGGAAKYGKAAGIMLDVVKKPTGRIGPKFGRVFVPITQWQIAWFAGQLRRMITRAAEIDWSADARRNVSACSRRVGNMNISCPYKELCRYGKDATANYVMGRKGESLLAWKAEEGKEVAPWI